LRAKQGNISPQSTHQPRAQKETRNCRNSVVALQDHCSYKAPTAKHHINKSTHQAIELKRFSNPQKMRRVFQFGFKKIFESFGIRFFCG